MSDKIIIPFDGRTEKDIEGGGVVTFIGYESLRRLLTPDCGLAKNEVIAGLTIQKDGITIKFETIKNS